MGLDMYLYKKTYVKNWSFMKKEELHTVTVKQNGKVRKDIKRKRICYIVEEVMYWRKSNAIHKWFVDNVQDGNDDCGEYHVSREQLRQLISLCEQVKKKHKLADELLPCEGGFFFGGTDYDEWYFKDLRNTIKELKKLVEEKDGDFYYHSSW